VANADRAVEAEKQKKFWDQIEARLTALENNIAPLQTGQMPVLVALPDRLTVLETRTNSLEGNFHDMETHVSQMDADLQELDADFTAKEARDSGLSPQEMSQKIKILEAQLEAFRELMQQVTKAQTADLEAIQKAQRILRSDLEAKPVVRGEGNDGITELQKRLERKADVDTVEQLLRGSIKTKEVISASFHGWLDMCVLGGAIQM
jgi:chromosome segregation ATPase